MQVGGIACTCDGAEVVVVVGAEVPVGHVLVQTPFARTVFLPVFGVNFSWFAFNTQPFCALKRKYTHFSSAPS